MMTCMHGYHLDERCPECPGLVTPPAPAAPDAGLAEAALKLLDAIDDGLDWDCVGEGYVDEQSARRISTASEDVRAALASSDRAREGESDDIHD
jgi:hypothetical protein